MPGSLLFCLLDHGHSALSVASHERLLHLGALVAEHGHDGRSVQFQRPLDGIRNQGYAQDWMQHLGPF